MNCWLIKHGEPLPSDSENVRLFRTGMLAERLAGRGHTVTWWTGTVDHVKKCQRFNNTVDVSISDRYTLRLLHAPLYRRNISLQRIINHRRSAQAFTKLAPTYEAPDVIVSAVPFIEAGAAATKFAASRQIPCVVDIRDMWPDTIADLAPKLLKPAAKLALAPMYRQMRAACSRAIAITGTTEEYVDWALGYAGRERSSLDRRFPMAYNSHDPANDRLADAHRFWARHGITDEPLGLLVVFVGALGEQFDLDTVIEAARRIERESPTMRFVICGDGRQLERYRRLAAGLENVVFSGWVGASEIWVLLRLAHLGLAPYLQIPNFINNIANKPVEYLSAGLPILSSLSEGPLAQLLHERGVGRTYRYGDPRDLVEVLSFLERSPETVDAMSRNAQEVFREQFDADRVLADWVDYLEEMASAYSPHKGLGRVLRRHEPRGSQTRSAQLH